MNTHTKNTDAHTHIHTNTQTHTSDYIKSSFADRDKRILRSRHHLDLRAEPQDNGGDGKRKNRLVLQVHQKFWISRPLVAGHQ